MRNALLLAIVTVSVPLPLSAATPTVKLVMSSDGEGLGLDRPLPASSRFVVQVDLGGQTGEDIQGRLFVWPRRSGQCELGEFDGTSDQSYELALFPTTVGNQILHTAEIPALEVDLSFCLVVIRDRSLRTAEVDAFLSASKVPLEVAFSKIATDYLDVAGDEENARRSLADPLITGQDEVIKRTLGHHVKPEGLKNAVEWGAGRFLDSEAFRDYQSAVTTSEMRLSGLKNIGKTITAYDAKMTGLRASFEAAALSSFKGGRDKGVARAHVWLDDAWRPLMSLLTSKEAERPESYTEAARQLAANPATADTKAWRTELERIGATGDLAARRTLLQKLKKKHAPAVETMVMRCGGEWKIIAHVLTSVGKGASGERPACPKEDYLTLATQLAALGVDAADVEVVRRRAESAGRAVTAAQASQEAHAELTKAETAAKNAMRESFSKALLEMRIDQAHVRSSRSGHGATPDPGNYVSLDAGFAVALPFRDSSNLEALPLPYLGINLSFAPVEREVPLELLVNPYRRRLSLTIGLSLTNQVIERALPGAPPATAGTPSTSGSAIKPLFGSTYPLVGVGWRLAHFMRLTVGATLFWIEDLNPAIDHRVLSAAPFTALSLDLDLIKFISTQLGEL